MSMSSETPQSVPAHLIERNKGLWTTQETPDWHELDKEKDFIISGSAFIDLNDPLGRKGNPFTVVTGSGVGTLTGEAKDQIALKTGTPETVFINDCSLSSEQGEVPSYELGLTVKTPTGKELGACAHGFTGAVQTLLELGTVISPSVITIATTMQTGSRALISEERIISLEFMLSEARSIIIDAQSVSDIFGVEVGKDKSPYQVLSVGSPKLTIEVTEDQFNAVQQNLDCLDYDALSTLQNENQINGIHLFCRDEKGLPAKVIQANAYLGRENVVDPATGVSCAAQVGSDTSVKEGETVKLTQYTAKGPSADLYVTKKDDGIVLVGGTAVLFNFEEINPIEPKKEDLP